MKTHSTIEAAMNDIRLYQHSKQALVQRKDHSTATVNDYDDSVAYVCAMQSESTPTVDAKSLEKELRVIKEELRQSRHNVHRAQEDAL